MAKNKKSKILAMALCASVMTGIYAAPVMAATAEEKTQNITSATDGETVFDGKVTANKFGTTNKFFYVDVNGTIKGTSLIIGKNADNAVFMVDRDGAVKAANGAFTVEKDGKVTATEFTVGGYNLTDIGAKTAGITQYKNDTTYFKGAVNVDRLEAGDTVVDDRGMFVKENGDVASSLTSNNLTVGGESVVTVVAGNVTAKVDRLEAGDTVVDDRGMFVKENGDVASSLTSNNLTVGGENLAYKDSEGNINVTADTYTAGKVAGENVRVKADGIYVKNGGTIVSSLKDDGLMLTDQESGETHTLNATDIADIKGIDRETITDEFGNEVSTTTIEGALKVSDNGLISNADGSFTVDSNGGLVAGGGTFAADMTGIRMSAPVQMTLQGDYNYKGQSVIDLGITISDIDDRLDVLEDKTQNIKPGTGAGTGTGEGGTAAGEGNNIIDVPATEDGHTGINGDVTVGGNITAGTGNIGDVTMSGGNINTEGVINAGGGTIGDVTMSGGNINTEGVINAGGGGTIGGATVDKDGNIKTDGVINAGGGTIGDVTMSGGNINTEGVINAGGGGTIGGATVDKDGNIKTDGVINAGGGTIGDVTMSGGNINTDGVINAGGGTIGNATFDEDNTIFGTGDNQTTINNDGVTVGGENGTSITGEGITVGDKNGVSIKNDEVRVGGGEDGKGGSYMNDTDVVSGEGVSLNDTAERVGHLENRVGKLEDRIDKVGAMAAAIANLRTMGYDPAAPTEVAVGIGQYRDETGAALGLFHYPNRDFMLSLSVSTSGDEVMGGIGATWKFGRKSPEKVAEIKKAQAEADVRRAEEAKLAKAEEMKKAAKEAKIKAQQERHAKLAAERAAQAEAAK